MWKYIKYTLFIIIILATACNKDKLDPIQTKAFIKIFGVDGEDIGNDVKQTADGGYILIGTATRSTDEKGEQLIAIKTDAYGNYEWVKEYGFKYNDKGNCVLEIPGRGYLLFGTATDSLRENYTDMYFIIIDELGGAIIEKTIGIGDTSVSEEGNYAALSDDGGFILVGNISLNEGDIYFLKTNENGDTLRTGTIGESDGPDFGNYVLKIDNDRYLIVGTTAFFSNGGSDIGAIIISEEAEGVINPLNFGGTGNEEGLSAAMSPNGDFYIFGSTTSYGNGGKDFYLVKTDNSLNIIKDSITFGFTGNDEGKSICYNQNNEVVMTGTIEEGGKNHCYLVKTDINGDTIFNFKSFNYLDNNVAEAITETADGGYAIVGSRTSHENTDILFYKTNPNGELKME